MHAPTRPAGRGAWPDDARSDWHCDNRGSLADDPAADRRATGFLLEAVEAHAAVESAALATYQGLAETLADPLARLAVQLVLSDEARHRSLLQQLATSLRDDLEWRRTADSLAGAEATAPPAAGLPDAIAATRGLAEEEHACARQLRELARQSGNLLGGLPTLLLEAMALDSRKHQDLLRFALRRLQASAPLHHGAAAPPGEPLSG